MLRPPSGPHKINQHYQVTIPEDVRGLVKLGKGDEVYLQVQESPPGTVLIIPMELMARWVDAGRSLDVDPATSNEDPDPNGR